MSDSIILGLGAELDQRIINSRSVSTEDIGIQRLTESYTCTSFSAGLVADPNSGANLPEIYSIHPEFSNMSCENVQVTAQDGGLADVTVQYVGFLDDNINFSWPPDGPPQSYAATPIIGSGGQKASPSVRCFPAGAKIRSNRFPSSGDWAHYPLVVEIDFIDSISNETLLYSDWRVNETRMPEAFRGTQIPAPETSPYRLEPPEAPNGFSGTLYGFLYSGVVLSGLSVTRRGGLYNQIKATFKDKFEYLAYQYSSA